MPLMFPMTQKDEYRQLITIPPTLQVKLSQFTASQESFQKAQTYSGTEECLDLTTHCAKKVPNVLFTCLVFWQI